MAARTTGFGKETNKTTKPIKKEDAPTPAPDETPEPKTAISQTVDEALLKFHDELIKTGHVEVAANILRVHKILTKDAAETANGVVEAFVKDDLTPKEIVKIALAIFCAV